MIVTRKVFKSLDLELFRLTRKKSADPVARSSGQACPARQSATLTTLQFTAVLLHFTILEYILLHFTDQTVAPFVYVCAIIYAMLYFHNLGVTLPGPTLHST